MYSCFILSPPPPFFFANSRQLHTTDSKYTGAANY